MSRKCPSCAAEYADDIFFCGEDGTITVEVQDPADFDPRLGEQLGGYIVVARVADGAMGRVYEGRHPETKARVAIKVLHADVARDDVSVERFRREYDAARELGHPNIVSVLEFGETKDGSWFLTMEYLVGEELGNVLRRDRFVDFERAVRVLCQLCRGLDHAHSYGLIHRDLKPDNIFLVRGETGDDVRVLDFGSVKLQMETGPKLTAFGTTLGSPYYMSPEQAMGKQDVDLRTDVFAASAILYEMLTGKVAFEGAQIAEILMKIVSGQPDPASAVSERVPPSLDAVFTKGFQKNKLERYATAGDLAKAFLEALGLPPDVERWAQASVEDIRAALSTTAPKSLRPGPARPSVPPASAASAVGPQARPDAAAASADFGAAARPVAYSTGEIELPTRSPRMSLYIGVAVAALAGLGLLFALLR